MGVFALSSLWSKAIGQLLGGDAAQLAFEMVGGL